MKILQSVAVKQILTEKSKGKLLASYENNRLSLQKECEQLRFECKKMEHTKKFSSPSLKIHFEKEINTRQEKIKLLDFQIEQLNILPLGSELKEQEIQALVDVKVGDHWEEIKNKREIIITDGVITELR
ncbi:YlqD family protein [Heyndrickxia acidicola]|uniref:YlqD family protein n=1 Tax=Heyndrickxia acidicola TaxID=209389 RepID=A0ABU6MCF2_9BACI|nr:YlqD family protein [Heyndrickxia acidicola]MED1202098.1 YlqD family protein [Heyndrickxia acidicola]